MALASFATAFAPGPWTFLAALAVYGPACGVALAAAEGLVVESNPAQRDRAMARFGIAGALGDLLVPVLLAGLAWLGLSWRAGFVVGGTAALALAVAHAASPGLARRPVLTDDDDDQGSTPSVREALATAFRTPGLLTWSVVGSLNGLLDEVLVAFAIVHLESLGASPYVRAAALFAWTVGGLAGLAVLERNGAGRRPERVLLAASVATAVALIVLATTRSPLVAAVALGVVGVTASVLHPLAKARAYAALPGRPDLVNGVAAAVLPFDALAPLALAFVAARSTPAIAVALLLVGPLGVALASLHATRSPSEK